MRVERVPLGAPVPEHLAGAILARDLSVGGQRWSKGRRLSTADLARLATTEARTITLLLADPGELHEDDAALRLAAAVTGPNLAVHGPAQRDRKSVV